MRVAFHGWPGNDETIDTVMFDPNQKPDTARAENSIFGSPEADNLLPKDEFPDYAMRAEDAFQLVSDELMLDGNARQNLATFCQTWDEKQVRMLMNLSINKNMIDKDEYPQTAAIEMRCAAIIANLWNASQNEKPIGCSAIGSSEACMLGGMAALWRWRARRKAAGKPIDKPNLVCGPVQICWHKFCRYWDIEMREIPMAPGKWKMDVDRMLEQIDENTIVVVPTFGVTYTGAYELPAEIAKALDDYENKTGISGEIANFAINFSRPAGQIICQYYDFIRLGKEGYTNIHTQAYEVAKYISDELSKLGPYEFICTGDPEKGIPAVCFFIKDGARANYTLFDLSDKLRTRGWQVPAFTLPANCQDTVVMRVMVRQGFSKDLADLFLEDYKRMLSFFEKHPVSSPMTAEEGTAFHHS